MVFVRPALPGRAVPAVREEQGVYMATLHFHSRME